MKPQHALLAAVIALIAVLALAVRWRVSEQAIYTKESRAHARYEQLVLFGQLIYCKRSIVDESGRVTLVEGTGAADCLPAAFSKG